MFNDNVKKLPDAYYKGKDGNNYKLLHLNEIASQVLNQDITDVLNSLDLEQATGATLDLYGEMLGQKRGSLNDTSYRMLLRNKIGENICQSDFNSVLNLLAQIFSCDVTDFTLEEVPTNKIDITQMSLKMLGEAGFTGEQAIAMIERLLPTCVRIRNANIEGTFEFGDVGYQQIEALTYQNLESETYANLESGSYDENKGFGNIEQTIGGYFGLLVTNDIDLPI